MWSALPIDPIVARQLAGTRRISPAFDITMYGGLVFSGHLDVIDSSRATIRNRDYDMTGSIGILGQLKF